MVCINEKKTSISLMLNLKIRLIHLKIETKAFFFNIGPSKTKSQLIFIRYCIYF